MAQKPRLMPYQMVEKFQDLWICLDRIPQCNRWTDGADRRTERVKQYCALHAVHANAESTFELLMV